MRFNCLYCYQVAVLRLYQLIMVANRANLNYAQNSENDL